jgi:aerobic carbon-monoxide dehydrogenase medium subunit
MKAPPFEYHCPQTLDEALALLAATENAKVLAGGQSLMAMLNLRYIYPDALIDINRIPDLSGIKVEGGMLKIGAMTRQRHIELGAEVKRLAPVLTEAVKQVGHRQTRNRGTIGGSLCHLDPASELPTVSLLYDATIDVAGPQGRRRCMPIRDFVVGYMTPGIEPDELVVQVNLPLWPEQHGHAFVEYARRHGDFAIASAGCLVERDEQGVIRRAAIAIGGVGSVPQRLADAEAGLVGSTGDAADISRAVAHCDGLEILSDFHGTSDYRRSVVGNVLRRSLALACQRAGHAVPA